MTAPIANKTVNALIKNAEIAFGVRYCLNATGLHITGTVIDGLKKVMGGLWVGGTATLYATEVTFRPNALNTAIHAGDYSIAIPLADVSDVQVRFGFVTRIIDVITADGTLSIRCFGASRFADMIR